MCEPSPRRAAAPTIAQLPQSQVDHMRSKVPMGRLGEIDESAAMVCFVASKECSFTTASTFDTSGGRTTFWLSVPDSSIAATRHTGRCGKGDPLHDIPFVDAHVHLWDLAGVRYPWLTPPFSDDGPNGSVEAIARTYLPADYQGDTARWHVVGTIHIEAGADPDDAVAETKWLEGLADGPDGIVAFAALDHPDLARVLAAHAEHPRVRGIRHIVNWHPSDRLSYTPHDVTANPAWERGFALLSQFGLSFDLQAYPGQFAQLATTIAHNPDIPVIIDHLGMPVTGDPEGRAVWSAGLRRLAALPNVAIKISGFGFVQRPWTEVDARPWILEAIDIFGTERACVASDYPTDTLFGTVDDTLGAYAKILAPFTESERRAMWGGNANRFYRLGLELKDRDNG